jgi:hypothetical protein
MLAGMSNPRAVRHRRLALADADPEAAKLFQLLADEVDRGILCVAPPCISASASLQTAT